MTILTGQKIQRVGRARLPRHDKPIRNTVSLSQALMQVKDRPDAIGLETLDAAAIDIGLKLRRARETRQLSQAKLAAMTGINQSAISAIESGKGADGPTYRVVREIALAMGFSPELVPLVTVDDLARERARTLETVQILDNDGALHLVDEATSLIGAHALILSVLPPLARREASKAVAALLKTRPSSNGLPLCSYWTAEPHSHGRLAARRDLVAIGYGGTGTVRRPSRVSVPASDKVVVVPRQSKIDVVNTGDTPFGFLTMPITPAVAASFDNDG